MTAHELSNILSGAPEHTIVVFEHKTQSVLADTKASYGIDEVTFTDGFVHLRSVD